MQTVRLPSPKISDSVNNQRSTTNTRAVHALYRRVCKTPPPKPPWPEIHMTRDEPTPPPCRKPSAVRVWFTGEDSTEAHDETVLENRDPCLHILWRNIALPHSAGCWASTCSTAALWSHRCTRERPAPPSPLPSLQSVIEEPQRLSLPLCADAQVSTTVQLNTPGKKVQPPASCSVRCIEMENIERAWKTWHAMLRRARMWIMGRAVRLKTIRVLVFCLWCPFARHSTTANRERTANGERAARTVVSFQAFLSASVPVAHTPHTSTQGHSATEQEEHVT